MSEPTACKHDWIDVSTFEDGKQRKEMCSKCKLTRIDCPDLAADLGALLAQFTWTTEKPTQEGWYWHKAGSDMRIVSVYKQGNGELAASGENFDLFDLTEGLWAGPLQPPTEHP